ncbi:restriction endonuclease [Erwinia sp. INIA-01]|uniref:restriction endonuclease n=1 Tax=Erwinia sp. INIA01 TaxID=2991500 RepID=UPI002223F8F6|nr:restriction endonuclease [Erwinia sp. INIA01]MCW1876256.1 restriction endonuclease [Erwinia sp. INIA01]
MMTLIDRESYVKKKMRPIIFAGLAILALLVLFHFSFEIIALIALAATAGYGYLKNTIYPEEWQEQHDKHIQESRDLDEEQFRSLTAQHLPVLARKKRMLVTYDDYGNVIYDRWAKEKEYYINKLDYVAYSTPFYNGLYPREQRRLLDDIVEEYMASHDEESVYSEEMSPIEYEHHCADLLWQQGWDTRVTQGSGDQGVDVLAVKYGIQLALQCKKYASPVGNKAVQEIIAGKGFYGADVGLVVSNNTYTLSARQLALSHSIILLHHEDLANIDELLGIQESPG